MDEVKAPGRDGLTWLMQANRHTDRLHKVLLLYISEVQRSYVEQSTDVGKSLHAVYTRHLALVNVLDRSAAIGLTRLVSS